MLDATIITQLTQYFSELESTLSLVQNPSNHARQDELQTLLQAIASCGDRVVWKEAVETSEVPRFEVHVNGKKSGVSFRGIPSGHEFSSVVLALLNADGRGKLPDAAITKRIESLKGPLSLYTYVSLACTNCPDVVQALNLMALLHDDFEHEMIDGRIAEDEIESFGIQAVPAVVDKGKIVAVGKATLGSLLEILEDQYGSVIKETKQTVQHYDVVVIGGGPAGCAAAIYSARKGLNTVIVAQQMGGQVRDTKGIENMISVPYSEGKKLTADLEKHVHDYPITVLEHRKVNRVDVTQTDGLKSIVLQGGECLNTETLIIASGAKWRELGIRGEKKYLGNGVAFCPHCEGPFYKGRRVAVVGGGNSGIEAAIDLAGICAHVTIVEFAEQLKADDVLVQKAQAKDNITVITRARTTEIVGDGKVVSTLRFQDRRDESDRSIDVAAVFVQIGLSPNSGFVRDIIETNRHGEIIIDGHGRTNVSGIYAAGDVSTVPFKQIVIAMGEGAKAALTAFEDRVRGAEG